LTIRGDEGRGKLRKAMGSGTHALIHRYPNGATHHNEVMVLEREQTGRTETSKYPEEKKTIVIPQVVASERGEAQTRHACIPGVVGLQCGLYNHKRMAWESQP
jgi:hypothetical protein